jgi:mono/diheme cytochrome c family protein
MSMPSGGTSAIRGIVLGSLIWTSVVLTVASVTVEAQGGAGGQAGRGAAAQAPDQPVPGGRSGQSTRVFLGLGPLPDLEAAKRGEPLYRQYCLVCHGDEGRGAQAPSLIRSPLMLHDENGADLAPLLKSGRGAMPAAPGLTDDEIYSLSQYVHLQIELTANRGTYGETYAGLASTPTGDVAKGQAFFNGAGGCTACHSVTGDLANIGARIPQAAAIKTRFLWPTSSAKPGVRVTTPQGQVVTGTLKTINDFDISILDSSGTYRYWRRSQVTVEVDDKLAGHRALLPKYSDADINNLAAYLVTLR